MKDTTAWISFDLISCRGNFSSTTFFFFSVLSFIWLRLLLRRFRQSFLATVDSGEEIVTNLYPRFIVGIQLGSVISCKANGFSLMKCLRQTCNVEFFSESWQVVKFFRLIFDSH